MDDFSFLKPCWNQTAPRLHCNQWGMPLHALIMNERCDLSHTHHYEPPETNQQPTASIVPWKAVMLTVKPSPWCRMFQMFWNQSDNKTIFRRGCPHMGEFTAGELCVRACNVGGVWVRSWQTSSSVQVVRLRAWKAKGRGGKAVEN